MPNNGIQALALVNNSVYVTGAQAQQMAEAIQLQIARDFAPVWNTPAVKVQTFSTLEDVPTDAGLFVINMIDEQDEPDAYGYHNALYAEIQCGVIFGNGGGVLDGKDYCISQVTSHEALETLADLDANLWLQENGGPQVALEVCDPVQSLTYKINDVLVSDFVTPAWFGIGSGSMDMLNGVKDPWQLASGGYCVQQLADGSTNTVFGAEPPPGWRMAVTRRRKARLGRLG